MQNVFRSERIFYFGARSLFQFSFLRFPWHRKILLSFGRLLLASCFTSCDNQTLWIMEMFIDDEQSSGRREELALVVRHLFWVLALAPVSLLCFTNISSSVCFGLTCKYGSFRLSTERVLDIGWIYLTDVFRLNSELILQYLPPETRAVSSIPICSLFANSNEFQKPVK